MNDLAGMFGALADPTRLEILALLMRHGELCVCDFVGVLGITQSKASRHLRYLWNAGLLADRREGLWVHYRLSPDLGEEGRAVAGALRSIFGRRDLADLDRRLERWLERRRQENVCAPRRQARPVRPARARRSAGANP